MAELVEEGADLAVGQQRGAGGGGRVEVAADEGDVGAEAAARGGAAGNEGVHPCALALGLAGEPVRVEGSEMESGLVADFEVRDVGVPDGRVVDPPYRQPEEPASSLEESGLDLLEGEPGPQHLVVHIEAFPADLLHHPGHVPGLQGAEAEAACVRLELTGVAVVVGARAVDERVEEGADPAAGAGHHGLEAVVGEVGVAEKGGEPAPQLQDAGDEGAVVALPRRAAVELGRVDLAPQGAVVGVLQHRLYARHVQGEEPPFPAPLRGELRRPFQRRLGESRERLGIAHDLAVGGGFLQKIFLEAPTKFGELHAQLLEGFLVGRPQLGPRAGRKSRSVRSRCRLRRPVSEAPEEEAAKSRNRRKSPSYWYSRLEKRVISGSAAA